MHNVIAEALVVAVVIISLTSVAAMMLTPHIHHSELLLYATDASLPLTSKEAFNLVMKSGSTPYSNTKLVLLNATSGKVIDIAYYTPAPKPAIKGLTIEAEISDLDNTFNTGDVLRFKICNGKKLDEGLYEIVVINKDFVVFDSYIYLS